MAVAHDCIDFAKTRACQALNCKYRHIDYDSRGFCYQFEASGGYSCPMGNGIYDTYRRWKADLWVDFWKHKGCRYKHSSTRLRPCIAFRKGTCKNSSSTCEFHHPKGASRLAAGRPVSSRYSSGSGRRQLLPVGLPPSPALCRGGGGGLLTGLV